MMLQITSKGLVSDGELDFLRDRFASHHCVVLENLLEPALLKNIQQQIERAAWQGRAFDDFGTELTLDNSTTINLLLFLLNNQKFLDVIRFITGCAQLSEVICRVYRQCADTQHQIQWHTDTDEPDRQVGFSLNLSTDVFRGGTFELRERQTARPLAQVNNSGFGDALLFRIFSNLEHRVTQVAGPVAKTACAGWFRATGKNFFRDLLAMAGA
jgi:hypothetical protein